MILIVRIPRTGDEFCSSLNDDKYIEGMTLTQHLNQMKLSAFIAIAAVIGASFIAPNPAEARNGWVYVTSTPSDSGGDASIYVKVTSRTGNIVNFISRWSDMGDFSKQVNCSSWQPRTVGQAWRDIMPGSIAETMSRKDC